MMRFSYLCAGAGLGLLLTAPVLCYGQPAAPAVPQPAVADLSELSFQQTDAAPFGLRQGQNLEYQQLDAKGKVASTWRYRVVGVRTDSSGKKGKRFAIASAKLKSGHYDLGNRVLSQQDLTYFSRRDTVYTDGLTEINYDGLKSFRERRLELNGTALAWPLQPKAGSLLPGGGAAVQVSSPSVAIAKVSTSLRLRTVKDGPVQVTVPAGTFTCYTVECQREQSTAARSDLVLKNSTRQLDYYAPAVGIVKTEYFDKNGKLMASRVLAKY